VEHTKLLIIPEHFGSEIIKNYSMRPILDSCHHRQEKPDLQEPPESAPVGIVVALSLGLLTSENTLFISVLPQALQVTVEISEEIRNLSKTFSHDLQVSL